VSEIVVKGEDVGVAMEGTGVAMAFGEEEIVLEQPHPMPEGR
jgi:hypothetical protein